MQTPPSLSSIRYDSDDSEDILGLVRQLIDGDHPGVLTTVDPAGVPHARWMSTLAMESLPDLYTLTSSQSRKVEHLASRPSVDWMFSNRDLSLVVNLTGMAEVISTPRTVREVWNRVRDKKHAYFLNTWSEGIGYVVIHTRVTKIVCTTPKAYSHFEIAAGEVARTAEDS